MIRAAPELLWLFAWQLMPLAMCEGREPLLIVLAAVGAARCRANA